MIALAMWLAACGGPEERLEHPDTGLPARQVRDEGPPGPVPVVELRNASSRLVTFRVTFDAGSADDPGGKEGVTALAARLVAEGGTRELTYGELVAKLFPMAADIRVDVGRDQTVFVGRTHEEKLEEFYALFHDVILEPRMGEEDFRRLKDEATNALTLELRGNDDEDLGKEALQWFLYDTHPYAHPSIGTERGLAAITLDDVRAQREAVLCRRRVTLGIAGGYPEGFAARVARDLEGLSSSCHSRADLPPVEAPVRSEVLIIDKPEAASTAISIGFPIRLTRKDEDFAALQLVTGWFGQHRQFAGVLFQKMRADRGLNYGDYAYPEYFAQDSWSRFPRPNVSRRQQYWSIWIRPVEPQNAHFALRAAVRELKRLVDGGFTDADFERTKVFLDRYVGLFEQTESRRLGNLLDDRFYGLSEPFLAGLRNRWRGLNAGDVRRVVRETLSSPLRIAIVHKDARALAEAIASEAPSPITYREPKPEAVLTEDREIQAYPLRIDRQAIRVMPVAEMFR